MAIAVFQPIRSESYKDIIINKTSCSVLKGHANAECHCPPMAIGTTGTVPVALVPVRPSSRRYSLRSDTIRFIGMFYNREYILHRDVPYYTSPPASVSLSTTSPRFAGKPAAYRSLTG